MMTDDRFVVLKTLAYNPRHSQTANFHKFHVFLYFLLPIKKHQHNIFAILDQHFILFSTNKPFIKHVAESFSRLREKVWLLDDFSLRRIQLRENFFRFGLRPFRKWQKISCSLFFHVHDLFISQSSWHIEVRASVDFVQFEWWTFHYASLEGDRWVYGRVRRLVRRGSFGRKEAHKI